MQRPIWKVVLWLALITGLAIPALSQTVEMDSSSFTALPDTCIVDDDSAGFTVISGNAIHSDWPIADAVCGYQGTFKTCEWLPYHIPLGLAELPKAKVCTGIPYGNTVHWTAQFKPGPDVYYLDNHAMQAQTAATDHNICQWAPNLASFGTGCYEVWVYIPWNTTSQAPYKVSDAYGASSAILVKQYCTLPGADKCSSPRNKWVRLDPLTGPICCVGGNKLWRFDYTGATQWVQLDDQTGETDTAHPNGLNCVVFDAVAFRKVCSASVKVTAYWDTNGNNCIDASEKTDANKVTGKSLELQLFTDANCSGTLFDSNTTTTGFCVFTNNLKFKTTYYAKVKDGITPPTTCPSYKWTLEDCVQGEISVPVRCNGSITVYKVNDTNMSGGKDGSEQYIDGWPVKLTGKRASDNSAITPQYGLTVNGFVKFSNLEAGTYTVTEETDPAAASQISWQKVQHGTSYDWAGTWKGAKWLSTSPVPTGSSPNVPTSTSIAISADDKTYTFYNVPLGTITVTKFKDCNMNSSKDAGEVALPDWPVKLTGTRTNGTVVEPVYGFTNASGIVQFPDLAPGSYTVSEETNPADPTQISWQKVQTTVGTTTYYDRRTTWKGKNWQSTNPPPDSGSGPTIPSLTVTLTAGGSENRAFGNVPLTTITGFKFLDLNMNGKYDATGEQFYDKNGDHIWNDDETYTDTDGDHCYDYPERPIGSWPFIITGKRMDNRPVEFKATTGSDGYVKFADIAPSDATGYNLRENLNWVQVTLPGGPVWRATYEDAQVSCPLLECDVDRWQATTAIEKNVKVACEQDGCGEFGNICLVTIDGTKWVYNNGYPGPCKPGEGWRICLTGKDLLGKPVIPCKPDGTPMALASSDPIDMPGEDPDWYEMVTAADGEFAFCDLLPGHYHLSEIRDPRYQMIMKPDLEHGCNLLCCSRKAVEICNVNEVPPGKLYQVDPGNSGGTDLISKGYMGDGPDAITALPGIFAIDPGENWKNFIGEGYEIKDITLTKQFSPFIQCANVFEPVNIVQRGPDNIRLWWPLMYEPPTTMWTLKILYGDNGEMGPSMSEQSWVVDTDIPHMILYLDLIHEVPFGKSEVPLISDEVLYKTLRSLLTRAENALDHNERDVVASLLTEFEMTVVEACIYTQPPYPIPTGQGTGIANTDENPACCKLLVDTEYVAKKLGVWTQSE